MTEQNRRVILAVAVLAAGPLLNAQDTAGDIEILINSASECSYERGECRSSKDYDLRLNRARSLANELLGQDKSSQVIQRAIIPLHNLAYGGLGLERKAAKAGAMAASLIGELALQANQEVREAAVEALTNILCCARPGNEGSLFGKVSGEQPALNAVAALKKILELHSLTQEERSKIETALTSAADPDVEISVKIRRAAAENIQNQAQVNRLSLKPGKILLVR
ncbi:MAG: hypothetical protein HY401_02365 [Elusimicrobia bacterium]|nr:hypothetical protein [Elusimicrobiota bacterium]